jgi:UDP-glucose 4-epimerase
LSHCCVIGGSGFIGSHVVELLVSQGRQVTVIGRNEIPTRPIPKTARYVAAHYDDEKVLSGVLHDVDEIIHLANSTVPKTSLENPVQDLLANVPASIKLFDAASRLSIRKLVFVSSGGTVYGKTSTVPTKEDDPKNPISPYGITKLAIENYALMFSELKGLPVVCVRPGNAYGERQRPFLEQGFVATAISSVLTGKEVVVFGENGTIRDYVYVKDVARGILASLDHGKVRVCYNIGTGIGKSNLDVLDAIRPCADSAGYPMRVRIEPARPFDVPINILDSDKLHLETGWQASMSFEEGIRNTWNWHIRELEK